MMKKNFFIKFWLLVFCFSCDKRHDVFNISQYSDIIFILEANNDLKYEAFVTLNKIESQIRPNTNVYAYVNSEDRKSHLLKIRYDTDLYKLGSDTLAIFEKEINNIVNLERALVYLEQIGALENVGGIVLWSHATSWAPASDFIPRTRSFGDDRGSTIDITELANILPSSRFLVFDACNMGSIEVIYEFKEKFDYIIASPTETLANGIPYETVFPYLIHVDERSLKMACEEYLKYYKGLNGMRQSASIALYKTNELKYLADEVKILFKNVSKDQPFNLNYEDVSRLDFSHGFPIPLYDFGDLFKKNLAVKLDLSSLEKRVNKSVLYKNHTEYFLGQKIQEFSGLSIYIPPLESQLWPYYKQLKWAKDIGVGEFN